MIPRIRKVISTTGNSKYLKSYLLKNAKVVNPDISEISDVLLEDGKVA